MSTELTIIPYGSQIWYADRQMPFLIGELPKLCFRQQIVLSRKTMWTTPLTSYNQLILVTSISLVDLFELLENSKCYMLNLARYLKNNRKDGKRRDTTTIPRPQEHRRIEEKPRKNLRWSPWQCIEKIRLVRRQPTEECRKVSKRLTTFIQNMLKLWSLLNFDCSCCICDIFPVSTEFLKYGDIWPARSLFHILFYQHNAF